MPSPGKFAFDPLLLAGIFLFALVAWALIINMLGRLAGWARLALDYRSDNEMPATRFRMRSALLRGWAHYGKCITFGVDARGLHLSSFGALLGHPRLFIPWSDVSVTPKKVWWARCVELRFRRAPEIPVLISARLADKINPAGASRTTELKHAPVAVRSST